MDISIRGKSSKLCNKEIRYAANFCMNQLISKRLSDNITCRIDLNPKEVASTIDDYYDWASIEPEENYWEPPYRRFVITAYSKCPRHVLLTKLFHEFVHVKQYATGEMHDLAADNMVRFRKKRYINDTRDLKAYKKLPWEKEAYKLEGTLYRAYRDHLKQNQIKF
jgi:hypothetical protein